jgi:hypothetical protein
MNAFRKHGVPEELAKGIKVDQLIVTKVDEAKASLLLGLCMSRQGRPT